MMSKILDDIRFLFTVFIALILFSYAVVALAQDANYISQRYVGLATWYGPLYEGQMTASGEVYDPVALSAAHKNLPFNSIVRVTNVATGQSIELRINDRIAATSEHDINLSQAAAAALGVLRVGSSPVQLEVIDKRAEALYLASQRDALAPQASDLTAVMAATQTPAVTSYTRSIVSPMAYSQESSVQSKQNLAKDRLYRNLRAMAVADLTPQQVIVAGYELGQKLHLASSDGQVVLEVQVISNSVPQQLGVDILLAPSSLSYLGQGLIILDIP